MGARGSGQRGLSCEGAAAMADHEAGVPPKSRRVQGNRGGGERASPQVAAGGHGPSAGRSPRAPSPGCLPGVVRLSVSVFIIILFSR